MPYSWLEKKKKSEKYNIALIFTFKNSSMGFKMKGGNEGRGSCSTMREIAIPLMVLLKLSEPTLLHSMLLL